MDRMLHYSLYTEEAKMNAVAAVRAGLSQVSVARRLGIPGTTLSSWVKDERYSEVGPASREVLAAIPEDPCKGGFLAVPTVGTEQALPTMHGSARMRITCGKLAFESEGFTPEEIGMIIRALGEADVL